MFVAISMDQLFEALRDVALIMTAIASMLTYHRSKKNGALVTQTKQDLGELRANVNGRVDRLLEETARSHELKGRLHSVEEERRDVREALATAQAAISTQHSGEQEALLMTAKDWRITAGHLAHVLGNARQELNATRSKAGLEQEDYEPIHLPSMEEIGPYLVRLKAGRRKGDA